MGIPDHIAIIMDGNGRWANKKGLPRISGHKAGADSVHCVIESCLKMNISALTLFAFSTENWQRPIEEVNYLLDQLFVQFIENNVEKLNIKNIKFQVIGEREKFNRKLQQKIIYAEEKTQSNTKLILTIAISYSGRWDIIQAFQKMYKELIEKNIGIKDISEEFFAKKLITGNLPDPDLLIRTSGEKRISNFMLWQLAYTELYFTDVLWPDFRENDLLTALYCYENRIRRFGKC